MKTTRGIGYPDNRIDSLRAGAKLRKKDSTHLACETIQPDQRELTVFGVLIDVSFFVATAGLTMARSISCFAQERPPYESSDISRED
jgi:hypothetical protein